MFYLAVGLLRGRSVMLVRVFKVFAFLGALAIIPLFLLQAIVLKAFCTYCVATEVLMLAIWILSFLLAAPGRSGEPLEAGAGARAGASAVGRRGRRRRRRARATTQGRRAIRPAAPVRFTLGLSLGSLLDGQHLAVGAGHRDELRRSPPRSP